MTSIRECLASGLSRTSTAIALATSLLALLGCPTNQPSATDGGGDGGGPTDDCHSPPAAENNADCQLTLGTAKTGYINPAGDREWYHLTLPTNLPVRPLLHVTAQISAPSSPVTLNVNVQTSQAGASPTWADGGSSLVSLGLAQDPRSNGEPQAVIMTIPMSGVSGDLYFLLDDAPNDDTGGAAVDLRHPFNLTVTAATDPDTAGHTQATATPITLSPGPGGASVGYADGGVLSTVGDTDFYSVVVPAMTRPILYVDLQAPSLVPPPQSRLTFTIYPQEDAGAPIGAASTLSPVGVQEIATAKLLPGPDTYIIEVTAYQSDPTAPPPPGDPRLSYTLNIILIDDLDTNEPNDTWTTATPVAVALGTPTTIEGRIAYCPDPDWYQINIPPSADNTLLKYQISYDSSAANNARYPAIEFSAEGGPSVNLRDFAITLPVLSPDGGNQGAACEQVCPADMDHNENYCTRTPTQCDYTYRLEDPINYPGLDNFLGVIPIPAHATTMQYLMLMEIPVLASDDRAYQIVLNWEPETPNEASTYQDTVPQAIAFSATVTGSYSEVPPASAPQATGELAYGLLGRSGTGSVATNTAPLLPIYNAHDYDALNDTDLWSFTLPTYDSAFFPDGGLADAGAPDLAWSLSWTIPPAASQTMGERPEDIFITFFLCDPTQSTLTDAGSCDPLFGQWSVAPLGYDNGKLASWYGGTPALAYDFDQSTGTFSASPNQCLCLESRFAKGGQIYMAVSGVDRATYDNVSTGPGYSVQMSFSPYPQPSSNVDGGFCPTPCQECEAGNGGCNQVTGIPGQNPAMIP